MVVLILSQPLRIPSPSVPIRSSRRASIGMTQKGTWQLSVLEFPHLSSAHRNLMLDLLSTVETRLGPKLLPTTIPPDVASFHDASGNSQGALDIRSGHNDSKVDFILASWLHCNIPSSAATLDIATLFAYLNPKTDAPHLLLEFIQSSPTSLVLFIDLLPRKDLVLDPNYIESFYQKTDLDALRRKLDLIPGIKPYSSSSLYIRGVLSPTAIAVTVDGDVDEVMRDHVDGVAKEVVRVWLEECAIGGREIGEIEREGLVRRDGVLKRKTVEIDLASNLPRLFGQDVAGRIMDEIQKVFGID